MEVASCIERCNLLPLVSLNVVNFTLIHRFLWQGAPNRVNHAAVAINQHRGQSVRSPFEYHVAPLHQPFIQELITGFRGFPRLAATRQEYPSFLVLDRHEVCRDLDVHNVTAVAVRLKVVQEQIVRVVYEEVQCVEHFPIVANQWHLDAVLDEFVQLLPSLLLLLQQFNLHLLVGFPEQERGFSAALFGLLKHLVDLAG